MQAAAPYRDDSIGTEFQSLVRSIEWQAALVCYEKYRRKLHLNHAHLIELRDYVVAVANDRRDKSRPVHKDILIQEASMYVKVQWDKK